MLRSSRLRLWRPSYPPSPPPDNPNDPGDSGATCDLALGRAAREAAERQLAEKGDEMRRQLHDHSQTIDLVNGLRSQLASQSPGGFVEQKLRDTERRLLESEHGLGQAEARCAGLQAELAAAERRGLRDHEHAEEL
eukprot:gene33421-45397_t